jgi:ATP-binding cassette subfamily B protein
MRSNKQLPNTLSAFTWMMLKPFRWPFLIMLCAHFVWALSESLLPLFLKTFIDSVTQHAQDKANLFSIVAKPLALYITLWCLFEVGFRTYDFVSAHVFPKFTMHVRRVIFSYTIEHSHRYFSEHFAGTIASKISRMPDAMLEMINSVLTVFIPVIGAISISILILYFANPIFSLILGIWFIIHMTISYVTTKRFEPYSHIYSEDVTKLNGKIVDTLTNIATVRIFSRSSYEKRYLNTFQRLSKQSYYNMLRYGAFTKVLLGSLGLLFSFSMLLGGIYGLSTGLLTVGDFALVITSMSIMGLVWYMSWNLIMFFENRGTCQQALTLINQPHQIVDKPNAKQITITRGEIIFDSVNFHYENQKALFTNMDTIIHSGDKVGLVGYSGSGKTTFVNLILRNFDLDSGRILIDGQDISQVTQISLRRQISVIPQDSTLFHRTLMENIRYGNLLATDEEVTLAAKKAHAHEFISNNPDGYQALVGERGIKLSGGQRQRIAIARAFLKNAPVLILDEATASLDSVTEGYIQESLSELIRERTTIVIAHRLSTLREMNRILVFADGKIIADGTHEELLAGCPHYAHLWHTQVSGMLPDKPGSV